MLALLVLAGTQGLREGLPTPEPSEGDLARCSTRPGSRRRGVRRLPTSLPAALAALDQEPMVKGWLAAAAARLATASTSRASLRLLADLSEAEQARRYAEVY